MMNPSLFDTIHYIIMVDMFRKKHNQNVTATLFNISQLPCPIDAKWGRAGALLREEY